MKTFFRLFLCSFILFFVFGCTDTNLEKKNEVSGTYSSKIAEFQDTDAYYVASVDTDNQTIQIDQILSNASTLYWYGTFSDTEGSGMVNSSRIDDYDGTTLTQLNQDDSLALQVENQTISFQLAPDQEVTMDYDTSVNIQDFETTLAGSGVN